MGNGLKDSNRQKAPGTNLGQPEPNQIAGMPPIRDMPSGSRVSPIDLERLENAKGVIIYRRNDFLDPIAEKCLKDPEMFAVAVERDTEEQQIQDELRKIAEGLDKRGDKPIFLDDTMTEMLIGQEYYRRDFTTTASFGMIHSISSIHRGVTEDTLEGINSTLLAVGRRLHEGNITGLAIVMGQCRVGENKIRPIIADHNITVTRSDGTTTTYPRNGLTGADQYKEVFDYLAGTIRRGYEEAGGDPNNLGIHPAYATDQVNVTDDITKWEIKKGRLVNCGQVDADFFNCDTNPGNTAVLTDRHWFNPVEDNTRDSVGLAGKNLKMILVKHEGATIADQTTLDDRGWTPIGPRFESVSENEVKLVADTIVGLADMSLNERVASRRGRYK